MKKLDLYDNVRDVVIYKVPEQIAIYRLKYKGDRYSIAQAAPDDAPEDEVVEVDGLPDEPAPEKPEAPESPEPETEQVPEQPTEQVEAPKRRRRKKSEE